tara:strand:- start:4866 stop:5198 length:333 start_codon:yes stop_codon:yes gene_type:complete
MNWYKRANMVNIVAFVAQWIQSAYETVPDATRFVQEIQALDPMTDPQQIRNSIDMAAAQITQQQGGQLTPTQSQFIQLVNSTINDPAIESNTSISNNMDQVNPEAIETIQ